MRMVVLEDHKPDCEMLCAFIQHFCQKNAFFAALDAYSDAEAFLASGLAQMDIAFIDVYLPGQSGMEAARQLRAVNSDCLIVFVTQSEVHALEAFSVQPLHYIVKPLSDEKMQTALELCRRRLMQNARQIWLTDVDRLEISIPLAAIYYIEARGKFNILHTKARDIVVRESLSELERRIGGAPFLRCHRSYLVNMNWIESVSKRDFLMKDGAIIPIRTNGRGEVKLAMAHFITKQIKEVT